MRPLAHFMTITKHKKLVAQGCFAVGLYWQGLTHDLSKYSPSEFWVGARYYQGTRSPNNAEREDKGYSGAWLHHKGKNKHHYEYWIDYSLHNAANTVHGMLPSPMPIKYIVEMLMDRIAASKVYNRGDYTQRSPLEYYNRGMEPAPLHPKTKAFLELFLHMIAIKGEKYTFDFVKNKVLPRKNEFDKKENLEMCILELNQDY